DPDGDQLFLVEAVNAGEGSVQVRQDGTLTFTSGSGVLGEQVVRLVVSDGELTVAGTLVVDVRQPGSVVPVIDPVHAVTVVGVPVTVRPLASVRSASREPVRLAGVDQQPGVSINADLDAGTFTFTATTPGGNCVTFVVRAATEQARGVARFDVVAPSEDAPPTAVLDVALLPPGGEVVVDPLANDSDPFGKVLVLTSVDPPPGSELEVAILDHQLVRITSSRVVESAVSVPYTVSNGTATAVGEIRVKPTEVTAGNQAPVVRDLTATVRTGGVVTVPVLSGAYDPDGDPLAVVPTLVKSPEPGEGLAFVSGDLLRFQAPDRPGTVRLAFGVTDGVNTSNAWVTVSIHASDPNGKSAPRPKDLVARVFLGETIRIPVPLTGIDPDGDGVTLLGLASPPGKGQVQAGADWLEYTSEGGVGTDTFTYAVEDWTGQRSVATVRVGIAPRPQGSAQVIARDDRVTVRPGRSVEVRVLANDVDNSGDELQLDPVLDKADDVQASVVGRRIVVQAPDGDDTLNIRYTARNLRGGMDTATLTVEVSADAPIAPPVAQDVVVPATQTLNATSVEVDVLEVAANPSGPLSDLRVSVDPSAADVAQVTARGTVEIVLGRNARTIPYLLTNTAPGANGVRTYAFITVPALGDFPPVRRPGAPALTTYAGRPLTIDLNEQIQVAPGREVQVDRTSVTATRSDGPPEVKDSETLVYTSPRSFSGLTSITFLVRDGASTDPKARSTMITLPITVFAREANPPTFEPSVIDVAPGEVTQVDLAVFVKAPVTEVAQDASDYTYRRTGTMPGAVSAQIEGSTLRLTGADNAQRGSVGSIGLEIDFGGTRPLLVAVDYRVVASQRPLARVLDQTVVGTAGRPSTVQVLATASNPFPGTPLRIVDAVPEAVPTTTVSIGDGAVVITPPQGFVGPLSVRVRVRDATGDPGRDVDGRITVVVRDVPAAPTAPRVTQVGDKSVTLAWDAPAPNGAPITGYRVLAQPAGSATECPGTTCVITGLTNDQQYTFVVVARNEVGDSPPSPASAPARPDVRPGAPGTPTAAWGDRQVTASWAAPVSAGSPVKDYQVELSPAPPSGPAVVTTTSTSYAFTGLTNGTAYSVRVRATNAAPDPGDWSGWSATTVPAGTPGAPGAPAASGAGAGGGVWQITVTWEASNPNGYAVTSYEVSVGGGVVTVDGFKTAHT
ncbi:MAG TPA: Ig-like domain-containing protein, partial [Actinotalea sp.]|nr:Ig-like domain-containing protein [Actinotalea sp.]